MTKLLPALAGETCSPAPGAPASISCPARRRPQSLHGPGRAAPSAAGMRCRGAAPLRAARGARPEVLSLPPATFPAPPGELRRRGSSSPCSARGGAAPPGAGGRWPRGAELRGTTRSGAEPPGGRQPPPGAARSGAPPPRAGGRPLPQVSVRRRRRRCAPPARSCSLAPSPAAWAESY